MRISAGWFGDVDTIDWVRGLVSAFITGGSSAGSAALVALAQDPQHYAIGSANSFRMAGGTFLVSGVLAMLNFLRTRPLPELKTVETTVKTIEQPSQAPVTVTTVKETQQVPIAPPGGEKES